VKGKYWYILLFFWCISFTGNALTARRHIDNTQLSEKGITFNCAGIGVLFVQNSEPTDEPVLTGGKSESPKLSGKQLKTVIIILSVCILLLVLSFVLYALRHRTLRQNIEKRMIAQNERLTAYTEKLLATNDELQRTYDELNRYKNSLEQMVEEKTTELQRAFRQVQESDKFKAAFFANMSHEIRTPLNAILGFLQFVSKPSIPSLQKEKMIEMINSNAYQLISLVDNIVDLSKIDSGLLTLHPENCRIDGLMDELYDYAEQLIRYSGKKNLTLSCENKLSASRNVFAIDGKRVKQVLMHLLNNAVKFTESGAIMFGCRFSDDDTLLYFFVEDTGIGILPEHQQEIFKRFWKLGEAYTQRYRGIGLGLSLCESLVQMMNGSFFVTSSLGHGSTFIFSVKSNNGY
jgi:signal transduction histidine kinase